MNKVIILGRLGQDPELKYLPNGSAVCHLSVATSESWNDKNGQRHEKTEWHRVVVWGKLAELANQYLSKGRQVLVEGKLQTRSWEDKDKNKRYATEVLASTVQFIGGSSSGKSKEENHHDTHSDNSHSSAAMDEGIPGVDDVSFASDDVPF